MQINISSAQKGKTHNGWHPIKNDHAYTKKQENTIQDEKKSSFDANIRITKQGH